MANQDPQQPKMNESSEKGLQERSPVVSASQEMEVSKKSIIREYAEALVIAIVLALTIRVFFVVQAFKIPSGSMIPTLLIGDHILVSKLAYGFQLPKDCEFQVSFPPVTCFSSNIVMNFHPPQRGDIIVFRYPEDENKDFIKRVIGIPGDTIQIQNKNVMVNGRLLKDEAFTQRIDPGIIDGRINPRDNLAPLTVPPDSYFVMGDNRDQSLDSRFWGFVRMDKIKGRAFLVYWSWNGQGAWTDWIRWERIGKIIE
ncbi:MAG: signal peptidase I [Nitrospirales bacterium]